jgi:hypothetical protein
MIGIDSRYDSLLKTQNLLNMRSELCAPFAAVVKVRPESRVMSITMSMNMNMNTTILIILTTMHRGPPMPTHPV